jgi:hypothetical protein
MTTESNKRKIAYIFCYARSGGTLLNRFLSNIDDLVILSEAHNVNFNRPNAGMMSIKNQVKEWYGIEVKSNNYIEAIDEIFDWCEEHGKTLVLRDWPYIDFARSNLNNFGPSQFSLNYELLSSKYELSTVAFVRDAIDVFLSSKHVLEQFSEEYVCYVRYLKKLRVPTIKYEDFCNDYQSTYIEIAQILGLKSDDINGAGMFDSNRVVGDINFSRGNSSKEIKILKRRFVMSSMENRINSNKDLIEANETLNYYHSYRSREVESSKTYFIYKLKSFSKKIDNVIKKIFRLQ